MAPFVVLNLDAQSQCEGLGVHLTWGDPKPGGTQNIRIVRRTDAWPFDLTDTFDDIYNGPNITEFTDTGVMLPITSTAIAAAVGALSITAASAAGYALGDSLRIESLTGNTPSGAKPHDIVTITGLPGGGVIQFTPALAHTYAVGARVAKSRPLEPQTYYYYLVLASLLVAPTTYDIENASRVFGLSIDEYRSYDWLQNETPRVIIRKDAQPASEGGGAGFFSDWLYVMGCWANLLRGHAKALARLYDADEAPFHVLTARNQSLGIDPEGFAYDFDVVRRPLTALAAIYKIKGTCPGIVQTVSMFTKWDSECVELGLSECQGGPGDLKTWDGGSVLEYGQEPPATTQTVISADGTATFTDPVKAWAASLWNDGTLRGWIGDIACVLSNVGGDTLITKPPRAVTEFGAAVLAAPTILVLSTVGFAPGMTIQVVGSVESSPGVYPSEVFEISTIVPGAPGVLGVRDPRGLLNAYPSGGIVCIGKSIVRDEYVDTATGVALQVITSAGALFVQNQWRGYALLDAANVAHNVVSNTGSTITVDGVPPVVGTFAIARAFTLGGTFALRTPHLRYSLGNGVHTYLFEPTFDMEVRGTIYDPFSRLWGGPGLSLFGSWGPADVGVYITTPVTVTSGHASTVAINVLTLDTSQPAPAVNALVGLFLNPNANQEQFFEVVSNTALTVTVVEDISSLVVSGQIYYVLQPRDLTRFRRVLARLRDEFTDSDSRVHVFFA